MLIAYTQVKKALVDGTAGQVGSLKDVLFDDESWVIRYVVLDTGKWLPGREVPLLPTVLTTKDWGHGRVAADVSEKKIEEGPTLEAATPVSRQMEMQLAKYYDWPIYWAAGAEMGGPPISPSSAVDTATQTRIEKQQSNLRSAAEVLGYQIDASDGEIGGVSDLIIDDESWVIRYVVVDTGNWLPGRKVLFSVNWSEDISWTKQQMRVDLTLEDIKSAPTYDPRQLVNREFEERLYDFHGRPKYWL